MGASFGVYVVLHVEFIRREVFFRIVKCHKKVPAFEGTIEDEPMRLYSDRFAFDMFAEELDEGLLLALHFLFFPVVEHTAHDSIFSGVVDFAVIDASIQ